MLVVILLALLMSRSAFAQAAEGYAWPLSGAPGDTIEFFVSGVADPTVQIYRHLSTDTTVQSTPMGLLAYSPSTVQPVPPDAVANGCDWAPSFSLVIPTGWPSGIYSARLVSGPGSDFDITFVVKPGPAELPTVAVLANTNTWNAYNGWGGGSKYGGLPQTSFMRPNPLVDPDGNLNGSKHLARGELWVLGWLDAEGYDAHVFSDLDFHNGEVASRYDKLILSTHPEYFTSQMLDQLELFLDRGGSLFYIAGNGLFEVTEYVEPERKALRFLHGLSIPGVASRGDALWRQNGRPEISLLGVGTTACGPGNAPSRPFRTTNGTHPLFAGTGTSTGTTWGGTGYNVTPGYDGAASGWEVDTSRVPQSGSPTGCGEFGPPVPPPPPVPERPVGLEVIATADDPMNSSIYGAEVTSYFHPGGGRVVSVGSLTAGGSLNADSVLAQLARNVLGTPVRPPPNLHVDLRSTFLPGTEVAAVVTQARGVDSIYHEYERSDVSPSEDLLSGIRVADLFVPAIPSPIVLELTLVDSSNNVLRRFLTSFYMDTASETVLITVSRDGFRLDDDRTYWTFPTSDGHPPVACAPNYAVDGIRCRSSYCDDVSLHCKRVPGTLGARRFLPPITDDPANDTAACDRVANELVTGIVCTGDFCDNVQLSCEGHDGAPHADCGEVLVSPLVSEELGGEFRVGDDNSCYVRTMTCSGSFCDDKALGFDEITVGPIRANEGFDNDGLCLTLGLASPFADLCKNADGPVVTGHLMHWVLNSEGLLMHGTGQTCIGASDFSADTALVFQDCNEATEWEIDVFGLIRTQIAQSLCLGVDDSKGQSGEGPLVLVDCANGVRWTLTQGQTPASIPAPRLILSEYVEGEGVDDALELTNKSMASIDLADYAIQIYASGSPLPFVPAAVVPLGGVLGPDESFVVVRDDPGTNPVLLEAADLLADALVFDGAETILLQRVADDVVVDSIGQLGAQLPAFADGQASTRKSTLRRLPAHCTGDRKPTDAFYPSDQWSPHPPDLFDDLGSHVATCVPEPSAPLSVVIGTFSLFALGRRRTDSVGGWQRADASPVFDPSRLRGSRRPGRADLFLFSSRELSSGQLSGRKREA